MLFDLDLWYKIRVRKKNKQSDLRNGEKKPDYRIQCQEHRNKVTEFGDDVDLD